MQNNTDQAKRLAFERKLIRAKHAFTFGMGLMGLSVLLLGVIVTLYQNRNTDALGRVLDVLLAACLIIGMLLLHLSRFVGCPGCRKRVVLGRGGCGAFCQTCGGQIARRESGEGFHRTATFQCSGCRMKPVSEQFQNISSIRHCPHCGLKLKER